MANFNPSVQISGIILMQIPIIQTILQPTYIYATFLLYQYGGQDEIETSYEEACDRIQKTFDTIVHPEERRLVDFPFDPGGGEKNRFTMQEYLFPPSI